MPVDRDVDARWKGAKLGLEGPFTVEDGADGMVEPLRGLGCVEGDTIFYDAACVFLKRVVDAADYFYGL